MACRGGVCSSNKNQSRSANMPINNPNQPGGPQGQPMQAPSVSNTQPWYNEVLNWFQNVGSAMGGQGPSAQDREMLSNINTKLQELNQMYPESQEQGIGRVPASQMNRPDISGLGAVPGLTVTPVDVSRSGRGGGTKDFFTGTRPSFIQAQRFLPGQYEALGGLLNQLKSAQSEDPYSFKPIRQEATQQFNQSTLPGIAERFAGMNALGSSGFQRQATQAGKDFQTSLGGLESKFALQRMPALNQLASIGLTEPYLSNLASSSQGGGAGLLNSLIGLTGTLGKAGIGAMF